MPTNTYDDDAHRKVKAVRNHLKKQGQNASLSDAIRHLWTLAGAEVISTIANEHAKLIEKETQDGN